MKTRLTVDVKSEDFEKELTRALTTRMKHYAQGQVQKLWEKNLDKKLDERITKEIKESSFFDSWKFKNRVEDILKKEFSYNEMVSYIRKYVEEQVKKFDIKLMVEDAVNRKMENVSTEIIKEKLIEAMFPSEKKNQ